MVCGVRGGKGGTRERVAGHTSLPFTENVSFVSDTHVALAMFQALH